MILVEYCENSKAYRLMNPKKHSNKIYKGRNVDFIEIRDKYQKLKNKETQEEIETYPLICKQQDESQDENEIE